MNDLISRQVAIDALKEHRAMYCDNTPYTFSKLSYAEKSRVDELDTAIATLVNLPSAQPEIIRCKDCKFFQINKIDNTCIDMMCTENYDCYGAYMSTRPDEFCSNAERKE